MMLKTLIAITLAALAAASATAQPNAPGIWAIVKVDPGNYTEVYADECNNRNVPPVQIAPGLWRISNPYEQTIQFICVRWRQS